MTENKNKIAKPEAVDEAFQDLVNQMYIANISNRLRQLNQPTDNDCKRWFWELVQNAKDSIAHDPVRKTVRVEVKIENDGKADVPIYGGKDNREIIEKKKQ